MPDVWQALHSYTSLIIRMHVTCHVCAMYGRSGFFPFSHLSDWGPNNHETNCLNEIQIKPYTENNRLLVIILYLFVYINSTGRLKNNIYKTIFSSPSLYLSLSPSLSCCTRAFRQFQAQVTFFPATSKRVRSRLDVYISHTFVSVDGLATGF